MDIALINSWLLTIEGKGLGLIKNGGVGVKNGILSFVGTMDQFHYKNADMVIDGKNHHLIMPGLINSHLHSMLTLCRGTVHDIPEEEYIPKGLKLFANKLRFEDFLIGSKLAIIEGLRSGTTTFDEYSTGVTGLVKQIYKPLNLRVVPTEMINQIDYNQSMEGGELYHFQKGLGTSSLRRANRLFKEYKNENLITPMYGPQALDMLSIEFLKEIKQCAEENESKMHMHIAQGKRERKQIKKHYGHNMTTVKVLKKHNLLDKKLIAAHIHDTTIDERKLMIAKGVCIVGCPGSISKIDGMVPPIADYISQGGIAGIGTDEAPGTGHHNLLNEIRLASLLSKVINKDPTSLPPWEALRLATKYGSYLLGVEDKIGSLKKGKDADIITINLDYPHLSPIISKPFSNIGANLVYSNKGNEVDNVIIAGKPIMLDNKIINLDEEKLIKKANSRARDIFQDIEEDWIKMNSRMVQYYKEGYI